MQSVRTVVSFSVFQADPFGHGGQKRSYQIKHLISANRKYELVLCPFKFNSSATVSLFKQAARSNHIFDVLKASKSFNSYLPVTKLLGASYNYYCNEKLVKQSAALIQEAEAIVWENTFPDFAYLPYAIKKQFNKKVIACPHNLESLIPHQKQRWSGNSKFDYLEEEIQSFRQCDEIFTISEEDQWLLNLFDIPAHYLPYFPVGELYEALCGIRKYREKHEPNDYFLIVGSIANPPTRAGMSKALRHLSELHRQKCDIPVLVTGFGTEVLAKEFNSDLIKIVGASHENTLREFMKHCKGAIISQGYSTGALTKIPELLVAGIPLVVDEGGSRSFKRFDGIQVFKTKQDLKDITMNEFKMPALPGIPTEAFSFFQQSIIQEDTEAIDK
jgi:hypothetical protein